MLEKLQTVEDVHTFMEVNIHHLAGYGFLENAGRTSKKWLEDKRKNYSGQQYIQQLEKNAVYLSESTQSMIREITRFLVYGEPRLDSEQIQQYVYQCSSVRVRPFTDKILQYLRGYTNELPPDRMSLQDWDILREVRNNATPQEYKMKLESVCQWRQVSGIMADGFFSSLADAGGAAGIAQNIDLAAVLGAVTNRIDHWANVVVVKPEYKSF